MNEGTDDEISQTRLSEMSGIKVASTGLRCSAGPLHLEDASVKSLSYALACMDRCRSNALVSRKIENELDMRE